MKYSKQGHKDKEVIMLAAMLKIEKEDQLGDQLYPKQCVCHESIFICISTAMVQELLKRET